MKGFPSSVAVKMWFAAFLTLALAGQLVQSEIVPVDYAENVQNTEGLQSRIVSGWAAQPGQHPHQVAMRMVNVLGLIYGCGGSVVHKEWVLTAAHCTASYINIVIRAGLTHISNPEILLETQEYYIYPTFDVANHLAVQLNDISIVKLPSPLTYSDNLRSIRLQPSSDAFRNYDREIVYASGFGQTWTNGPQSDQLLWVYLRGVSNSFCAGIFSTTYVSDNTICAGFFNVTSQSICYGDSGGPLVHVSASGEPILVGISSFVAGEGYGCHVGLPAAFIRPGPFLGWLQEVTGIDFENLNEEDETTIAPTTTTEIPTTIPETTTTTPLPTTLPSTTTTAVAPTTTPEEVEEEEEDHEEDGDDDDDDDDDDETDIEDPELNEILKRLEVKVKVKVSLGKYLKKKKKKINKVIG